MTQRERMLDAVIEAVAEKGYAETTVADVVARAGVSRRTFYEQFEDKLDCFLEAYVWRAEFVRESVAERVRATASDDWRVRLRAGLAAYLEALAARPASARVLNVDVLGAGPRALEVRERVLARFTETYRGLADDELLRGLVGGIAEMVQARLIARGAETLLELLPTIERLAHAVVEAGDRGEALFA
jgi:AcrR family transcriptional regulator